MRKYFVFALIFILFSCAKDDGSLKMDEEKRQTLGGELLINLVNYYSLINTAKAKGVDGVTSEQGQKIVDLRAKINKLIDDGADLNYTDDNGNTAIYVASVNNDKLILKKLIENEASLKTKTPDGFSLLYNAISYGNLDATVVLMESGADPDGFLEEDEKPLNVALLKSVIDATYTNVAFRLISMGANVNIKGENEDTILLSTIKLGNETLALDMIRAGADTRFADTNGVSVMEWAVIMKQNDVLEAILQKDKNAAGSGAAQRALALAMVTKNNTAYSILSGYGLSINASNKDALQLSLCQGVQKHAYTPKIPPKPAKGSYLLPNMDFIAINEKPGSIEVITKDSLKQFFVLQKPLRVVLDFYRISGARNFKQTLNSKNINTITVGRHQGFYRVVLYLKKNTKYKIQKNKDGVTVL